jgi:chromosome segregation ATPase
MITNETQTVSQDDLDYFSENFTMQGLKYVRAELVRDMEFRRQEINHLDNEMNRIQSRLQWYRDGLEGQRAELQNINAAMEHLKLVSQGLL